MIKTYILKILVNLWKDDRAFWQIAAGLGAKFLGDLLGGNKNKQESTTDRTETLDRTSTSSAAPVFNTEALPLAGASLDTALGQLNAPINFDTAALDNLQLQQGGQVNAAFEGAEGNLNASLAARGLTSSPGVQAVSRANLQGARANTLSGIAANIAQQKFNIPLMQEEIRRNRLQSALSTLGLFRGQTGTETTTGTNRTTGTSTGISTQGNPFGNALGLAGGMALEAGLTPPKLIGGGNLGDYVNPKLPKISLDSLTEQ